MKQRWILALAVIAACGKGGGSKSEPKPEETGSSTPDKPVTCPAGQVAQGSQCVTVVTPEAVTAVAAEKTRLEELAGLLDKVDAVSGPIELINGIRGLDQWKKLAAGNKQLAIADQVVAQLDEAVKQVRTLEEGLTGAATRLGNLKGELDTVLQQQTGKTFEQLQAQVSGDLRAALEPLAEQLATAAEKVLVPVSEQVSQASDLIIGACALAKAGGGGDQLKQLCNEAKDKLPKAVAFLEDAKLKPAALLGDVTSKLVASLNTLVTAETKSALDAAQTKVNTALKLPAVGTGSGSGSATP
jgi:hypothetical protein